MRAIIEMVTLVLGAVVVGVLEEGAGDDCDGDGVDVLVQATAVRDATGAKRGGERSRGGSPRGVGHVPLRVRVLVVEERDCAGLAGEHERARLAVIETTVVEAEGNRGAAQLREVLATKVGREEVRKAPGVGHREAATSEAPRARQRDDDGRAVLLRQLQTHSSVVGPVHLVAHFKQVSMLCNNGSACSRLGGVSQCSSGLVELLQGGGEGGSEGLVYHIALAAIEGRMRGLGVLRRRTDGTAYVVGLAESNDAVGTSAVNEDLLAVDLLGNEASDLRCGLRGAGGVRLAEGNRQLRRRRVALRPVLLKSLRDRV